VVLRLPFAAMIGALPDHEPATPIVLPWLLPLR
jgi:hypothetical protein